jgi:hypothetical protein
MQKHTKIYLDAMLYDQSDFIPCEICLQKAADIHHIDARGMGGDPQGKKDSIGNLMALCREHHESLGDKEQYMEALYIIHASFIRYRMAQVQIQAAIASAS